MSQPDFYHQININLFITQGQEINCAGIKNTFEIMLTNLFFGRK